MRDLNGRTHPGLERSRLIHETVRRLIGTFVRDVAEEVRMRVALSKVDTPEAVRLLDHPLVAFSDRIAGPERAIKKFLFERMYRHPSVMDARAKAGKVARDLFAAFFADRDLMPEEWHQGLEDAPPDKVARRVCDYIAGMTDRYAWREHERLFDDTPVIAIGAGQIAGRAWRPNNVPRKANHGHLQRLRVAH